MTGKYTEDLNDAIDTCIGFLWPKRVPSFDAEQRRPLSDIMRDLYNTDGSEFTHRYPYHLVFKITSNCNLRCKHCFYQDNPELYKTNNDLDEKTLFEYLKFFVEEINIINCTLTGGEIFTTDYLIKYIKYLKSKNVSVELLTNGTLINREQVNDISKLLNPLTDSVQISLEGSERINDFIRGKGVFYKAYSAVKMLVDSGIKVCISMTINSYNSNEIEKMYDICRELKISQLNIGRMTVCNEMQKSMIPNNDNIILNIAKIINNIRLHQDLRVKIRVLKVFDFLEYERGKILIDQLIDKEKLKLSEDNLHCRAKGEQVALFPDGNVSLCYNCDCDEMYIGNLQKKSFYQIWSERFNKIMFKNRTLALSCKKCKYVTLCKGGCPINSYNEYGTTDAPDGNCKYGKRMIESGIWQAGVNL